VTRDERIESHVGLVHAIARHTARRVPAQTVDVDELVGDGMVGLVEAADRFDDTVGVPFATYASRRIAGAMIDGLRRRAFVSRHGRARGVQTTFVSFADAVAGGERLAEVIPARESTPEQTVIALDEIRERLASRRPELSAAEIEVLTHAAAGLNLTESAAERQVAVATIKTLRQRVVRKLGARNIANAIYLAARDGRLQSDRAA
jgi:RNA polymerase sigma factor (sigma-70 family)